VKSVFLIAVCLAATSVAGCGKQGATETEVQAAVDACIVKGVAQFQPPEADFSSADPEMRAALEQQAKAGIEKIGAEHRQGVEKLCRESMPKVCAESRELCLAQGK
jgi:hypothetical protein